MPSGTPRVALDLGQQWGHRIVESSLPLSYQNLSTNQESKDSEGLTRHGKPQTTFEPVLGAQAKMWPGSGLMRKLCRKGLAQAPCPIQPVPAPSGPMFQQNNFAQREHIYVPGKPGAEVSGGNYLYQQVKGENLPTERALLHFAISGLWLHAIPHSHNHEFGLGSCPTRIYHQYHFA